MTTTTQKDVKRSVRVNLEMSSKCRETLEELSELTDASYSEVLRRALAIYDLLVRETQTGAKIVLKTKEGEREVILV